MTWRCRTPGSVLPALMAATMFLQIFLNPKPTDPVQARMMYIMPVVFWSCSSSSPRARALLVDEQRALDRAAVVDQQDHRRPARLNLK